MSMELHRDHERDVTNVERRRVSPQITSTFHGSGAEPGATGVLHVRSWGTSSQNISNSSAWTSGRTYAHYQEEA